MLITYLHLPNKFLTKLSEFWNFQVSAIEELHMQPCGQVMLTFVLIGPIDLCLYNSAYNKLLTHVIYWGGSVSNCIKI